MSLLPHSVMARSSELAKASYGSVVDSILSHHFSAGGSEREVTKWAEGAGVIQNLTSPSIRPKPVSWYQILTRQQNRIPVPPIAVLDPHLSCWAFEGSLGHVTLRLAANVSVTHIVIEHSPYSLPSAPRDMAVWAIVAKPTRPFRDPISARLPPSIHISLEAAGLSPIHISQIRYDIKSTVHNQSFEVGCVLPGCHAEKVDKVLFQVLNNWGGEHTCLYGLRVIGK
jgi:hypothetical protein